MTDTAEAPAPPGMTKQWAKWLLRVAVSAAILGGLAAKTDWERLAATVRGLRWSAAAASFAVLLAAQVISAIRWRWLARPLGFDGPLRRYVGFYFVGMFFNLLLPTSVGGDAVRAIYLNAGSDRKMAAFLSVLLDRLSGLLVLLAVACVAAVVCPVPLPVWVKLSVASVAAAAVVGLTLLPWATGVLARLDVTGEGAVHRLLDKVSRLAASLREALGVYRRRPRLVVSSTALSALVQASSVLQVGLLGLAAGVDVPWAMYGVAAPMVALLTLLPVSLNGMGVREAGMVLFMAPAGVPAEAAVAVAFLWFGVQTAAGLLGAGVYLAGRFPRPEVPHDDAVGHHPGEGRAGQRRAAA
jgi:glycosyltransferase 2 family protein